MDSPQESLSFSDVREFLFGLRNRGSKYGIGRMVRFAAAARNPEQSFPSIHVAGTNGKGSVCALLESALRLGGYRTGLFTSPHLVHLGERVQVDRVPLSEGEIAAMTLRLRAIAASQVAETDDEYPSFFEFMTLMAFLRFASENVDVAILEVGLGGRLDSTNIVEPEVCVITSIGLDHQEILGETIDKIATEKAGICKPGVPVVMGNLCEVAEAVVREKASELGCRVYSVAERFQNEELPQTNLVGQFQRWNAATALLTLEVLQQRMNVNRSTILNAFQQTSWEGRWEERTIGERSFIFDATHNPQGAGALATNLRNRFGAPRGNVDVIVGSLGLDRAWAVMRVIAPYARRIFVVRPSQPRALTFGEMRSVVPNDFKGEVLESSVEELFPGGDISKVPNGTDPVLLTGSIYLIGEILGRVQSAGQGSSGELQDRI
mgnify:FL=1